MKLLNCCIVCYRNINYLPLSATKNNECVTATFVRLFQRHINNFSLESTQIKVRSKALTILPRNKNGSGNEPIKFQACDTCSEILSLFNSSYGDLKCAEMKANWGLQQLANIIRLADYVPARRSTFEESVMDLEGDQLLINDMVKTIVTFRKKLQLQCRLHYNNQIPRVVLMKSSFGQISTEKMKNQEKLPSALPTKEELVSTAIKSLSSLQLILFLALFNPDSKDTTDINSRNFGAGDCLEQDTNFNTVRSLPSPSTVFLGPGYDVEFSTLDAHDADIVLSDYTTCGGKQFDFEGSLRNHELQCQSIFDTQHEHHQVVGQLKDSNGGGDTHKADNEDDSCHEPPTRNGNEFAENYTEYRSQIIKIMTTYCCSSCQFEFDSEKELEQHSMACSKMGHDPDVIYPGNSSNVRIKKEPNENPNQKRKKEDWTHLNGSVIEVPNQRHLKQINFKGSRNRFRCKQCGYRCTTAPGLDYHRRKHLGAEGMRSSCSFCGKGFILKASMNVHLRTHTGEKPFKCLEVNCRKGFSSQQNLQIHTQKCSKKSPSDRSRHHMQIIENVKTHCCPPCQLKFDSWNELKQHLKKCTKPWNDANATNGGSSNLKIIQDPIEISNQMKLRQKTAQGSIKTFHCDQCERRCNSASALDYHTQKHLGAEGLRYSCSFCGKKCISKGNMKVHMSIHLLGKKRFKCPEGNCEKAFSSQQYLQLHIQAHLGGHTGNKRFKCSEDNCEKAFLSQQNLQLHVQKCRQKLPGDRTRPNGTICSYCGKQFFNSYNMRTHLRGHTGEKPFKCPLSACGVAYVHKKNLRIHLQNRHKNHTKV